MIDESQYLTWALEFYNVFLISYLYRQGPNKGIFRDFYALGNALEKSICSKNKAILPSYLY